MKLKYKKSKQQQRNINTAKLNLVKLKPLLEVISTIQYGNIKNAWFKVPMNDTGQQRKQHTIEGVEGDTVANWLHRRGVYSILIEVVKAVMLFTASV